MARVDAKFLAEEDPNVYAGSFLMGEIGILLVRWRITRERLVEDRLFKLIADNREQPTDELMWGTPEPPWLLLLCGSGRTKSGGATPS